MITKVRQPQVRNCRFCQALTEFSSGMCLKCQSLYQQVSAQPALAAAMLEELNARPGQNEEETE